MEDLKEKKEKLQKLGLSALEDYLGVDISKIEPETLRALHKRAQIAMQFEREMNVSQRAVEINYLRVYKLIAEDKKELKNLIKKSLPSYI